MSRPKRLYIITGKGGVGKTATALALTKYLNSQGHKAKYLNFTTSSLSQKKLENHEIHLAKSLDIPNVGLNLKEASIEYVAKKLKSSTIAGLVVRAPFFGALVSMIPGFNYLIYLGKTLELLKADPELTLVLDSPSSGHALTMLEATKNFGEIFQSGILFEDTNKMIGFLYGDNFTKVNILCLPTFMAANEASELREQIKSKGNLETQISCNNSFSAIEGIENLDAPEFLKAKLDAEKKIKEKFQSEISSFIEHCPENNDATIIEKMMPHMERLV